MQVRGKGVFAPQQLGFLDDATPFHKCRVTVCVSPGCGDDLQALWRVLCSAALSMGIVYFCVNGSCINALFCEVLRMLSAVSVRFEDLESAV